MRPLKKVQKALSMALLAPLAAWGQASGPPPAAPNLGAPESVPVATSSPTGPVLHLADAVSSAQAHQPALASAQAQILAAEARATQGARAAAAAAQRRLDAAGGLQRRPARHQPGHQPRRHHQHREQQRLLFPVQRGRECLAAALGFWPGRVSPAVGAPPGRRGQALGEVVHAAGAAQRAAGLLRGAGAEGAHPGGAGDAGQREEAPLADGGLRRGGHPRAGGSGAGQGRRGHRAAQPHQLAEWVRRGAVAAGASHGRRPDGARLRRGRRGPGGGAQRGRLAGEAGRPGHRHAARAGGHPGPARGAGVAAPRGRGRVLPHHLRVRRGQRGRRAPLGSRARGGRGRAAVVGLLPGAG